MSTARLEFMVDLDSYEYQYNYVDVPVEVRRPNLTLAARSLCSQPIELEPGTYFVTARLPGGQELMSEVVLAAGEEATVVLKRESDGAEVRYDWQGMIKGSEAMLGDGVPFDSRGLEGAGDALPGATVREGVGPVLDGTCEIGVPQGWHLLPEGSQAASNGRCLG